MDLKDLLGVAWKRRAVVAGITILTLASAAAFAFTQPSRYESTAVLALTPNPEDGQGLFAADNLTALLGTYAQTAKSTVTLRRAESELGRPLPAEIETATEAGTGILRIIARSESPQDAAVAASATASAFRSSIADNDLLDVTLVDPAAPSATPVQPRPPLILGVAGVLGLFAGILAAFALETFRRRIETAADVGEHTTAPVVGRLPRQRSLERGTSALVWDGQPPGGLQESYRALRTNLKFLMDDSCRVLEVTSSDPGQGKSTVVANLAIAFGQIGVDTIIVDADLRRPRQHAIFGLDNSVGLSSSMAMGGLPKLKPSGFENVRVLTSGPVPPDPTEMLHIRFARIIDDLRATTGALMLIDTPPVLPVSDARLIAPHADGVLLLVTAGSQRPATLQSAVEKLGLVDASLLGVILNRTGERGDGPRGYYGYETHEASVPTGDPRTPADAPLPARRSEPDVRGVGAP
jgi:succinoglycan biosynthesis transport protein ExoP